MKTAQIGLSSRMRPVGMVATFLLLGLGGSCVKSPLGVEGTSTSQSELLQGGTVTLTVPLPSNTPMSQVVLGASSSLFVGNSVHITAQGASGVSLPS